MQHIERLKAQNTSLQNKVVLYRRIASDLNLIKNGSTFGSTEESNESPLHKLLIIES